MNKAKSAHSLFVGLFISAYLLSLQAPEPYKSIKEPMETALQTNLVGKNIAEGKEENKIGHEYEITYTEVNRVEALQKFLEKYNSPFANEAETFIRVADEQGLDYRLLPAISCMESTCGQAILPNTYNAWGWGMSEAALRNGTYIRFDSWEDAIETVGEGIAKNYAANGLDTPEKMAPVYTPPNSVKWRNGVRFFMRQIDEMALDS